MEQELPWVVVHGREEKVEVHGGVDGGPWVPLRPRFSVPDSKVCFPRTGTATDSSPRITPSSRSVLCALTHPCGPTSGSGGDGPEWLMVPPGVLSRDGELVGTVGYSEPVLGLSLDGNSSVRWVTRDLEG